MKLPALHLFPIVISVLGYVDAVVLDIVGTFAIHHGILDGIRGASNKSVAGVGCDIGLDAVVGAKPSRTVIAFFLCRNRAVMGATLDNAGIVSYQAAGLGHDRCGYVALVDASLGGSRLSAYSRV